MHCFTLFFMHCFLFFSGYSLLVVVIDRFFLHLGNKKIGRMVTLDKWSSYTVIILWEFAWADRVLVVLGDWLSHRGGHLNRLDCIHKPTQN